MNETSGQTNKQRNDNSISFINRVKTWISFLFQIDLCLTYPYDAHLNIINARDKELSFMTSLTTPGLMGNVERWEHFWTMSLTDINPQMNPLECDQLRQLTWLFLETRQQCKIHWMKSSSLEETLLCLKIFIWLLQWWLQFLLFLWRSISHLPLWPWLKFYFLVIGQTTEIYKTYRRTYSDMECRNGHAQNGFIKWMDSKLDSHEEV